MTWKTSIDDIKIICKNDGKEMILESSMGGVSGLYCCPACNEHVNIKVKGEIRMKHKDKRESCTIGGIVRMNRGTGFKISFSNMELSRKYKDMFIWILKDDKLNLNVQRGYFDKKE